MKKPTQIIKKYTKVSLMLRIFIGLVIGALLGLIVPSWTGIGISYLEPVCCSISSSNCCFLTCIQISQEAGQVVW